MWSQLLERLRRENSLEPRSLKPARAREQDQTKPNQTAPDDEMYRPQIQVMFIELL